MVLKGNILHINTRIEWRNWLLKNFNLEKEVWLVYPKKSSGEKRLQYNDAVEEALCFGWIDSRNKTLDNDHTMQRFSRRNPKTGYSQANIERLLWLSDNMLIHYSLVDSIQGIIRKEFNFPEDIIAEIGKDIIVLRNYQEFSDSYKRIRIAYIDGARNRPDEFKKRLNNFIKKTRKNKLIAGFGGIEKYYKKI
jgi:uncharacterized protein YdeI (YjbR/CyaY-like superfamily)